MIVVLLSFFLHKWLIARDIGYFYWLLFIYDTQDFSVTQRRHWNISNDGQAALTINRVTKTDEGVWECWELDSMGNVKQKAHVMRLVVTSKWLIICFCFFTKLLTLRINGSFIFLWKTDIPEEPYLELEGRRLANQATITVRENSIITLNCVVRGASPPVSNIFWYISEHNVSHTSKLLMEYSAEEDVSMAISLLTVNVTIEQHTKIVICQVFHVSWLNPATVSASFNVLCKYHYFFLLRNNQIHKQIKCNP
jgi:hypothetical protein